MVETCGSDVGIQTKLSMEELGKIFPDARVVDTRGAISADGLPGVVILLATGVNGSEKLIRINGPCPNLTEGNCAVVKLCLMKRIRDGG